MFFRRHLLLAAIGVGLMLVLLAATANVVRTGSSADMTHEGSQAVPHEIDPRLPIIPIWPPL